MCKRFIDCGIWKQPWYVELSDAHKVIWHYLTLQCDTAGLWKVEPFQMKKDTGIECSLDEFITAVNRDYDENFKRVNVNRIMYLPGRKKIWITGFMSFQYEKGRNGVNGAVPAVKGALNRLRDEGILEYAIENGFIRTYNYNDSRGCQPLARDKDKDKDNCSPVLKEEGGVGGETTVPVIPLPETHLSPAVGENSVESIPSLDKPKEFLSEKLFREKWINLPSPAEMNAADEILKQYGEDIFDYALLEAVKHKVKKIAYVQKICSVRKDRIDKNKAEAEQRQKQEELKKTAAATKNNWTPGCLTNEVFGRNPQL